MIARPFEINVSPTVLTDLNKRLARTRWPDEAEGGWEAGTNLGYMKELVEYWQRDYDWQDQQRTLNLELPK